MDGIYTEDEWGLVETLSPLPEPPDDPTNAYDTDPAAAAFGQMLFFDTDFGGPIVIGDDGANGGLGPTGAEGLIGCVSCHGADDGVFVDTRSIPPNVSLGVRRTPRNSMTLVNVAYYEWVHWAGDRDSLWLQAAVAVETGFGSDRLHLAHVMYEQYRDEYDAIFDPDLDPALDPAHAEAGRFPAHARPGMPEWDAMTAQDQEIATRILVNFGKAVAAYERQLVVRETAFDRYVAGDRSAISTSAKRGLQLFVGRARCIECHSGPMLSDDRFHNIGVPQTGPNLPETDDGRMVAVNGLLASPLNGAGAFSDDPVAGAAVLASLAMNDESLRGQFRTPGLRSVSATAPFMHTGGLASLRDVVEHYAGGGAGSGFSGELDPRIVPLALSEQDIDDLVAFMETLSGTVSADLRADTSH